MNPDERISRVVKAAENLRCRVGFFGERALAAERSTRFYREKIDEICEMVRNFKRRSVSR